MNRTLGWIGVALFLVTGLAAAREESREFVRIRGDWYRIEAGESYRVNPEVISVRFSPPLSTLDDFLAWAGPDVARNLAGLESVRRNRLGVHDLRIPSGSDVFDVLAEIRSTGLVDFAEENTFGRYDALPTDPLFPSQWGLDNTGQTGGTPDADVDAPEAWDLASGQPQVVVAVLDSGTDIDHEDLLANLWKNSDEIPGNGQDDDQNGYVDDYDGWDFHNGDNDPRGPYFHGTHVAGIVAATTDNGIGIAGVAGGGFGGSGARIMPLGVGDLSPDGSILDDAILYAADNGAQVITLSLTVGSSSAIDAALEYAYDDRNVLIDCAAGNNGPAVTYPANHPRVIAVAATDDDDQPAWFSNPGPEVEVAAPGVAILSTQPGNAYDVSDGTSFAAPHVAGLAALVYSAAPDLDNEFVRGLLQDTADDIAAPGPDPNTGWGRINARAALEVVSNLDPPVFSSITPAEGLILGGGTVTVTGQNFYGEMDVRFGGVDAASVVVQSPTRLTATVPGGDVLGAVEVEIESRFGSIAEPAAYTYLSALQSLEEPRIGTAITVHVIGPPLANWGLVRDSELGPAVKKGIVWDIAFSPDFEILHNAWKGVGGPLNGLGQGQAVWWVPDDPALVGQPMHFQAVFDNLPGTGNEFVLSDLRTLTILPAE
jgi:subtilisin family serine protease